MRLRMRMRMRMRLRMRMRMRLRLRLRLRHQQGQSSRFFDYFRSFSMQNMLLAERPHPQGPTPITAAGLR